MANEAIVLDRPEQIEAFAWLQVYHKLKLEVDHPTGPKWRDSPNQLANRIMERRGMPTFRAKAKTLAAFEQLLFEQGVLTHG